MEKQLMGNLDYFFICRELKQLEGARLDGCWDYPGGFRLRFRRQGMQQNLVAELGVRINLSSKIPQSPPEPTSFAQAIRQGFDNQVLEKVEQINFDRVLALSFAKGNKLVFEQLGKGNSIVVDGEGKIVRPMRGEEFSTRKLRRGEKYQPPPSSKKSPLEIDEKQLEKIVGETNEIDEKPGGKNDRNKPNNPIKLSELNAVSFFSKTVNLPPFYLEEALARAGFEKNCALGELAENGLKKVLEKMRELMGEKTDAKVYFDGKGDAIAFSPFALKKIFWLEKQLGEGQKKTDGEHDKARAGESDKQNKFDEKIVEKKFASFSEALDEYYSASFEQKTVYAKTGKIEEERRALEAALEQQKRVLEKAEEEMRQTRQAAEWIYANYQLVEEMLLHAREAANRKMDDDEMSRELSAKFGKKIVLRKGTIEIEA